MKRGNEIIQAVSDADSANLNMNLFKKIQHSLSSETELKVAWNRRIKDLGIVFSVEKGCYINAEGGDAHE